MTDTGTQPFVCPDCGCTLARSDRVAGLCAACLLGLGLGRERHEYRIVAPLGGGPLGSLHLAVPESDPRQLVTVKRVGAAPGVRFDAERIETWVEASGRRVQPSVLAVRDAGVIDSTTAFVVTDYVTGSALDVFCESHRPSSAARLRLLAELCRAVAWVHGQQQRHGHLTAANVLVVRDAGGASPRLRDVGLYDLAGYPGDPAQDVAALKELVVACLAPANTSVTIGQFAVSGRIIAAGIAGSASAAEAADLLDRVAGTPANHET